MAPLSGVILPRASANGGFVACVFKPALSALDRSTPVTPIGAARFQLYLGLLGNLKGIIDLNAEETDRTLQLRVS
jgi:hypothetical protein